MNTIAISLIEKKAHFDGRTYDHVKTVEVQKLKTNAHYISLQEIIRQNHYPILLEIQTEQLTTLLDCSSCTPYEFWYFDDDLKFTGKAYSLHEGEGIFQIQTQAKWILAVHLQSSGFNDFKNLHCSDLTLLINMA